MTAKGSARRAGTRMQERTGIEFQIHDIRRTVASVMGELGIEPHVIDRIQNHRIPSESRVTATYQTHLAWSYLREKREALETWSRHLDKLLDGEGDAITKRAILERRTYEGWNKWSSRGRAKDEALHTTLENCSGESHGMLTTLFR